MAEDPKGPTGPDGGNPSGNQNGNPDPNVVALQQKLSEKDVLLKKAEAELAEARKGGAKDEGSEEVKKLTAQVEALTGQIGKLTGAAERERLKGLYPDIVPELLLGKTQEEIDRLVTEQRKVMTERFGDLPSVHVPQYKDVTEVDAAMEALKADTSLSTEQKMQKLRELKLKRAEF